MENGEGSDPVVGLAPEAVEETDFAKVRRGYEPGSVRARLREAAEEIRRLKAQVDSLSNRIAELEATPAEVLESRRVAEALGDEATRILQSATDAAQERIERAEAERAQIVGEAQATVAATIEEGREQGRNMVLEARNVRERILADLAGRRREYQIEVEQLREMRERLLEALGIFREGMDGWIEELAQAGPRAEAAAEQAGLRVSTQPEPTVVQIEAEIGTARLAGMPLGGAPATEDPAGEDGSATDHAATDDAGADAHAGGDAGPERPPEDEQADPPARTGVRLYDVEAETDVEFDAGAGIGEALSAVGGDAPVAASAEAGSGAAPASDAEAIFARLRSITSQPVSEPPAPISTEPIATGGGTSPEPGATTGEPAEFADEFADEHEAAARPSDPDDLVGAARAVAVGGIARRLKRLIVDEQGDLLDGIRRNGARAVRSTIAGDAKVYTRAARVPMQDFASDIDVSIDDVDLDAAGAAILSVLVEPVRARLGALIEDTDDPDELSGAVRSIYRESRSRRADSAAEAAFSASWPEPIS